ncbi:hypothetical protein PHYSODRAFT_331848 [Phytophthora sojae]|uniref:Uncharacterized protein n=1 Tax=Phytophthora sojae (strain P6497) TaxID=1094619 RepID=G4ZFK0_PHYSP|nr:hypothetical protein PHYSODRAFT_331848 [Phytophthora sojae]EGZ17937.1 hypothetical protein PHYSODRAFT_331848 [Phytophthora sojae]|eukprot:XP_009526995.1 hypothetical protein PHYSODRAFT_331848 [Phytophthora sojae]
MVTNSGNEGLITPTTSSDLKVGHCFIELNGWYTRRSSHLERPLWLMIESGEVYIYAGSIPDFENEDTAQILEGRFNFIYGDAHGVTYLLDPRYPERGMDKNTLAQLVKYLGMSRDTSREAKLMKGKKRAILEYWRSETSPPNNFVHSQACNRARDPIVQNLVFTFFKTKNFDD